MKSKVLSSKADDSIFWLPQSLFIAQFDQADFERRRAKKVRISTWRALRLANPGLTNQLLNLLSYASVVGRRGLAGKVGRGGNTATNNWSNFEQASVNYFYSCVKATHLQNA